MYMNMDWTKNKLLLYFSDVDCGPSEKNLPWLGVRSKTYVGYRKVIG